MLRNLLLRAAVALATCSAVAPALAADAWPTRPLNLIVGAPPGGSMDVLARLLSVPLAQALGQPVVVLNRPGGGQLTATAAAASASDGHTVLLGTEGIALNVTLQPKQPDPRRTLQPLMVLTRSSLAIVAAPQTSYRALNDVVSAAKAQPGSLSYGSAGGTATLSNLIMVALQAATSTQLLHVPYTGGAPALQATMAGQTQLTAGTSSLVRQQVEAGKLRPIAVTAAARDPHLPAVSTMAELGYPQLTAYAWWGMFVPRSLPAQAQQRLHTELHTIMQSADMRERLSTLGMEIVASSPAEFSSLLDSEITKWGRLITENNVRAGE